jgi:hypothetical protein
LTPKRVYVLYPKEVDLRFTGPHAEGQFWALYGVDEIIFTVLKALLQTITQTITVHLCEIINILKN